MIWDHREYYHDDEWSKRGLLEILWRLDIISVEEWRAVMKWEKK